MPSYPIDGGPHHEGEVDVVLDPDGRPPATVTLLDADGRSVEYALATEGQGYDYTGYVSSPEDDR